MIDLFMFFFFWIILLCIVCNVPIKFNQFFLVEFDNYIILYLYMYIQYKMLKDKYLLYKGYSYILFSHIIYTYMHILKKYIYI